MTTSRRLSRVAVTLLVVLQFFTDHYSLITDHSVVFADVPRTIHYQGKLTEPDGSPLTGDHTVTLRLYDAATGGATLWEEQHQLSLVRDDNGIFSVVLGSQTPFGSSIAFNDPLWLTIEVDGAGEFLPRQPLSAVSYAINADHVDGLDSSQFVQLDASGVIPDATLAANVSRLGSSIDTTEVTDSTLTATDTADTFLTAGSGVTVTKASGSWTIAASGGGAGGDITAVTAGTGLTGGGTSGDVTLAVDVGTGPNQIVQLDATSALSAVSGANLTNLNAGNLSSGTVPDARLSSNVSLFGGAVDSAEVTDTTLTAADTSDTFLTAGVGVTITKGVSSWDISAVGSGGDITAVSVGTGLTGGGISGDVTVSLSTPVAVSHGGTGASTASAARTNLGAAASGANSDIISLAGLTTPLSIAQGGTGAATAAGARANLINCMPIGGVDDGSRTATFQVATFAGGDTTGRPDHLWPVPVSGNVDTFRVFVGQAPGAGDTWTVTLRKNDTNTALSCAISGASAQTCTDTGAVSVVAGDRLGVQFVESGTAANTQGAGWSVCFVPD